MTRINLIPVSQLHNKHLVAEWHELPRVFRLAMKWYDKGGKIEDLPTEYTLGKGHVKFFYDKFGYLFNRLNELSTEMVKRGYNPDIVLLYDIYMDYWTYNELWNDYTPTPKALELNRQRIEERLKEMEQ